GFTTLRRYGLAAHTIRQGTRPHPVIIAMPTMPALPVMTTLVVAIRGSGAVIVILAVFDGDTDRRQRRRPDQELAQIAIRGRCGLRRNAGNGNGGGENGCNESAAHGDFLSMTA